jgi:hypothetical protein
MREPSREPFVSSIVQVGETYSDVTATVSFGTSRTPDAERPTLVIATVLLRTDGTAAEATVDVNGATVTSLHFDTDAGGLAEAPPAEAHYSATVFVPPESSYTISNTADPALANAIQHVQEIQL